MSTTTPTIPPIPSNVGSIAGPVLLAHLLNWGLFGVLSMQVYVYYLGFPNDRYCNKALTYGVYLFEAVNTLLLTQSAFHSLAEGFGNMLLLNEMGNMWFSVPIMGGIVAFVSQTFYAYRISVLSQSKTVASFIVLLSFTQLGGAIGTGVEMKTADLLDRYSSLGSRAYIVMGIWFGGSALCDVIIAICMTFYLSRRRSGTLKSTQLVLRRIIRLSIETGTLTASVAILILVLALLPGHPPYYQTAVTVLGKLYSNSMLAIFNNRVHNGRFNLHNPRPEIETATGAARTSSPFDAGPMSLNVAVTVTREQITFPPMSKCHDADDDKLGDV